MPGVARPPLGTGVLIVRGSAPADTQAMFEGLPVPLLYHFGGLTSFINSRMIDSIDFYPGNFSVRYGRRRGGIVEVGAADIPRDAFHGVLDVNLIDASVLASTPIGDDAEVAVAFRRSYFDVIFGAVAAAATTSPRSPRPSITTTRRWRRTGRTRRTSCASWRTAAATSSRCCSSSRSDSDAALTGDFNLGTQFHRIHGQWHRALSSKVDQDIDLAVGYLDADLSFGEAFNFNLKGNDIYERTEWRMRVTDNVRLIAGIDLFVLPGDFTYHGPPVDARPRATPTDAMTFSNRIRSPPKTASVVVQPAEYLESRHHARALAVHPRQPRRHVPRSTTTPTTRAARCTTS